jgi:transposase
VRDIEFYAQVLGLEDPWFVEDVELSVEDRRIDITLAHYEGRQWPCPKCDAELALYDHSEARAWRHLDTSGLPTYLHARPPRVKCPSHGVIQVHLPWAEPRSRFTKAFERFAIDVLKETDISGASNILKMSWDECWGIMERAVARGKARKEHQVPALIGVDEKAARKGHSYLTLVYSIQTAPTSTSPTTASRRAWTQHRREKRRHRGRHGHVAGVHQLGQSALRRR